MNAAAFVPCSPLALVSTNEAMDLKHREGYRHAKGWTRGEGCYSDAQAFFRLMVRAHCGEIVTGCKSWHLVDLTVIVVPHRPWDDDAGSVIVKWVIDELAKLLRWPKDRRRIRWVRFRTSHDESQPCGVSIELREVSDA